LPALTSGVQISACWGICWAGLHGRQLAGLGQLADLQEWPQSTQLVQFQITER